MQCKEWDDANSELFKESHDEAVHKNSCKSRLYELISASLGRDRGRGGAFLYSRRLTRSVGLRVQAPLGARVQKVQRVQRVEVGAF